jgi:hypothetical protein
MRYAETNDEQSIFHRRRALARNENVWISLKCGKIESRYQTDPR